MINCKMQAILQSNSQSSKINHQIILRIKVLCTPTLLLMRGKPWPGAAALLEGEPDGAVLLGISARDAALLKGFSLHVRWWADGDKVIAVQ